MTAACRATVPAANNGANRSAHEFSWGAFFRDLFPEKTAPNVAAICRTGVRAAEYVVAGESQPSASALINLLRSPVGNLLLDALVSGVEWRDAERRLLEIQELQNKIELKRRELTRAG